MSPPIPAAESPLRVLCVDDNHEVADSEVDLLQAHGFDARTCYGGESALREAATFRPCVCQIDYNMPEMKGPELAVRLRQQEGGPPPVLVAVSARGDTEARRDVWEAGMNIHLVKPVDPQELVAVVSSMAKLCQYANARC